MTDEQYEELNRKMGLLCYLLVFIVVMLGAVLICLSLIMHDISYLPTIHTLNFN